MALSPDTRPEITQSVASTLRTVTQNVEGIGVAKKMLQEHGEFSPCLLEATGMRQRRRTVTLGEYTDGNLFLEGVAGPLIDKEDIDQALAVYELRLHTDCKVKPKEAERTAMEKRKALEQVVFSASTAPELVAKKAMDSVSKFVGDMLTEPSF